MVLEENIEDIGDLNSNPLRSMAVVLAVVILVFLALYLVLRSPFTAVNDISVVGAASVDQRLFVKDSMHSKKGEQLVDIDPRSVEEAVVSLPWVSEAKVERKWFQRLLYIRVIARTPAFIINADNGQYLVDKEGYIIGYPDRDNDLYPIIYSYQNIDETQGVVSEEVQSALKMAADMPETINVYIKKRIVHPTLGFVVSLSIKSKYGIKDTEIIIGDDSEFSYKKATISAMVGEMATTENVFKKIDVRVPSRPVVIG